MKPYETGICVHCGKKKEQHGWPVDLKCQPGFLDSGTAHLCREDVAAGMLEALYRIKAEAEVEPLTMWDNWGYSQGSH